MSSKIIPQNDIGYEIVRIGDGDYPEALLEIKDPPEELYVIGDKSVLGRFAVGIVGSRHATEYGLWAARKLAKRLSDHGVVVVSGMAEGIDSAAHQGALIGDSPTVAVMGTGIDICFPKCNKELWHKIMRKGAVISEYPPGHQIHRGSFPRRNRIISGLSRALIVAEAGLSSGSLITAELAASQGRDVYAIPGNINRRMSVGCNRLIRDGARPLVQIDDVLADMGIRPDINKAVSEGMGADERQIFEVAYANGELTIDEIAAICGRPASAVAAVVTLLEMKGIVAFEHGMIIPINQ